MLGRTIHPTIFNLKIFKVNSEEWLFTEMIEVFLKLSF